MPQKNHLSSTGNWYPWHCKIEKTESWKCSDNREIRTQALRSPTTRCRIPNQVSYRGPMYLGLDGAVVMHSSDTGNSFQHTSCNTGKKYDAQANKYRYGLFWELQMKSYAFHMLLSSVTLFFARQIPFQKYISQCIGQLSNILTAIFVTLHLLLLAGIGKKLLWI